MPFHACYYHAVWATKHRAPLITPQIETLIFRVIMQKSRKLDSPIYAINGIQDHIHVAVSISPKIAVSEWVKQVKGIASFEVNKSYPDLETRFQWQVGYGILTFGTKRFPDVIAYVERQKNITPMIIRFHH